MCETSPTLNPKSQTPFVDGLGPGKDNVGIEPSLNPWETSYIRKNLKYLYGGFLLTPNSHSYYRSPAFYYITLRVQVVLLHGF